MPLVSKRRYAATIDAMSLRQVNLNLLPILQALLRERSVAGAAVVLDLSPAATSEALGRLRHLLDDPLLVRVGRRMELTPRALELVAPVNALCESAESMLRPVSDRFDPSRSRRQFRIASNDMLAARWAGPLLHELRARAPGVELHFSDATLDVCGPMSTREIDLLLMPRLFTEMLDGASPLHFRKLYADALVLVFSADHPLARQAAVTVEDLGRHPQVLYNPRGDVALQGRMEREVMGGAAFNVVLRLPQVTLIPPMLVRPPCVAWLPRSLVEPLLGPLRLQVRELDVPVPDVDVMMAWSSVFDADSGHAWFRQLVLQTVAAAVGSGV